MTKHINIEVITEESSLRSLESEWEELYRSDTEASIYSSFSFNLTAWEHFSRKSDQLFVLVLKEGCDVVGIAPLKISRKNVLFLPLVKVVGFIAEWGDGDKPGVVTTLPLERFWLEVVIFLRDSFEEWDRVVLMEQQAIIAEYFRRSMSPAFSQVGLEPDAPGLKVRIEQSWDEFIGARTSKTRANWRRCRRKIFEPPVSAEFLIHDTSETVSADFERFVSIEQTGWKKGFEYSIGGSDIRCGYFKDLVDRLARNGEVTFAFIRDTSANQDIAAAIVYRHGHTIYGAHLAFNPSYSKLSPGLVMHLELLKYYFSEGAKCFDLLGFPVDENKHHWKYDWSDKPQETFRLQVVKNNLVGKLYFYSNKFRRFI